MDEITDRICALAAGAVVTGAVVLSPALPPGLDTGAGVLAGAFTVLVVRLLLRRARG